MFALPALGALASGVGLLAMVFSGDGPISAEAVDLWSLWLVGTVALVTGSGLFALVSWRGRVLARPGLALLGGAMFGLAPVMVISMGLVAVPWEPLVSIAFLALILSFGFGWIVLGLDTVRSGRHKVESAVGAAP